MKRPIVLLSCLASITVLVSGSMPQGLSSPIADAADSPGLLYANDLSTAADMNRLAFDVHRGAAWATPHTFHGDHDMSCGAPTTTRDVHENIYSETVWYCGNIANPHFMTGMNTDAYNTISFSPISPQSGTVVFPATATSLCWSQNLTDLGGRKWINVVVISDDRYNQHPGELTFVTPDHVGNAGTPGDPNDPIGQVVSGDAFAFVAVRQSVQYFSSSGYQADFANITGVTDRATRYRTCLRDNGNGTVTRTQARPGGAVSTVTLPGRFPAGPRVFIIEDVSYSPDKDPSPMADAYTWHWDAIEVSSG